MAQDTTSNFKRRDFLKTTAAGVTAASFSIGSTAQDAGGKKVRIGLIGCGGRGPRILEQFQAHGGYEIAAGMDYFQERADAFGDKFNLPKNRRFSRLSGYKDLLALDDLDAVAIISPPYFHPEQAAAAVEAGKHVYLAKPIAVDAPGVFTIEKSAAKAQKKNQAFWIDFQTRANEAYNEVVKRVYSGALGEITFGEAAYHAGRLATKEPNDGSPESRLRNWVFDISLSGDILIEQNIHALDVMSWFMQVPPLRVTGVCGRKGRTDVGDCNDHFALLYEYPDNVGVTFTSKQYSDGSENKGIICDIYGTGGKVMTKYSGDVILYGKQFFKGDSKNLGKLGVDNNIAEFHRQITSGDMNYRTVPESVRSHITALMGRIAAYEKRQVTWAEAVKSGKMETDLSGLKV